MDGHGVAADLEAWIDVHGGALLRFAYLLTADRDRAADAVQDALVAAYPRWERIVAHGDPGAYLRRSVVNAHTSRWRRSLRREQPVADVAGLAGQIDDPADRIAIEDALWLLCRSLPRKQRAAVVLRYYEGRSDAEIAATLDCSVSTVRSQIHRALATLRTRLADDEEEVSSP
ncbi:E family RNA polymerase sigma-70 factor [Prauserella sp. PE36]|uniref:SigE family RNA polymerase sigma factor n=1 Tax=Prauserella endophytica TaxID=1592324 RepID=A0ABY2S8Q9_9PSEU|nr:MULTISPECIES: SigE family RNA polymerase sigma factor [Prauserella]PXY30397.1 RNA polymerase subunit sigma-24 [Prauserella coralliicola]RBM21000.1 E family RNA polymerase sigma-70 factor [Prauserella sp. PE36]TKG72222.1 SigE family RNA polymerase sigma factor [Prauserella endophytica]